MTFPVGYQSLHPDASMNFQMNRWFGWVSEPEMLEEMRIAAPRIATYGLALRTIFNWLDQIPVAATALSDKARV